MVVAAALGGCGYFGPGPASEVAVADIVGRWTGDGCIEGDLEREVELVLRADRTYLFRWIDDPPTRTPLIGAWRLVGATVELSRREWDGYASVYPAGGQSPSGFLLFGGVAGCSDPDSWMVLRWSPLMEDPAPGTK
jgi:hypothetical protein